MKIAFCLHGLCRGSNTAAGGGAYQEKFASLLKKIDVADVFIHSWEIDLEKEINSIFKPQAAVFEPQKGFEQEINNIGESNVNTGPYHKLFRTLSFLYSRMMSVKLKTEHEKTKDFVYDVVVVCRFDVGHHNGGKTPGSHLLFDKNLDMSSVYQAKWEGEKYGSSDHWYYSNSKNIDCLGNLYENIGDYLKPGSDYDNLFKKERIIPIGHKKNDKIILNNHYLYMYHMMQNDIWSNSSFISVEGKVL